MNDEEDNKYLEQLYKGFSYRNEQFDKAILFVSSGSLALSISFIEKIVPLATSHCKILLFLSWVFEAITIILFTINHYLSMRSFNHEIKKFYKESHNKKAITVQNINVASIITLLAGLFCLIIFIFINIK
jgi:hypothetical protein